MTMNDTVPIPEPEREPDIFAAYTGEIPLGAPEPVHYDPDRIERLSPCNLNLGEVAPEHQTTNPADVTCALCAATLTAPVVDEEPAEPAPAAPERRTVGLDGFADLAPPIGPAPAVERTVTIEALTAELRKAANAAIVADFHAFPRDPGQEPELLPPEARAAVVVRTAGQLETVTDVETDVPQRNAAEALAWLLGQAQGRARNLDVELLMPTPDVLAALAGRPELQAWTERLQMRASAVKVGWLAVGFTAEGAEDLITAVADCTDPECVWHGECVTVAAGTEPVHFATWQTLPVRIPAVTR